MARFAFQAWKEIVHIVFQRKVFVKSKQWFDSIKDM